MTALPLPVERERFRNQVAPALAEAVCPGAISAPSPSDRFVRFDSKQGVMLVGGVQEERNTDLALAYGPQLSGDQPLLLVIPDGYAFPSLQRAALLTGPKIKVWTHTVPWGGLPYEQPTPAPIPTPHQAFERLRSQKAKPTPDGELEKAMTALHLKHTTKSLFSLVEWATRHPQLEAGHRRGIRAWHCAGQRVLSITPQDGGP